jgi:hypothetical protein
VERRLLVRGVNSRLAPQIYPSTVEYKLTSTLLVHQPSVYASSTRALARDAHTQDLAEVHHGSAAARQSPAAGVVLYTRGTRS